MGNTTKRVNQDKKEQKAISTRQDRKRTKKGKRRDVDRLIRSGNWEELADLET